MTHKNKNKKRILVQTSATKNNLQNGLDFFIAKNKNLFISRNEINVYFFIKQAIPIIDAAITKIIRLIGEFDIRHSDKSKEAKINNFLKTVKIGSCSMGINSFIFAYMNQLLTYGTSIGEIVVNIHEQKIEALYNASISDIVLKESNNPLDILIFKKENGFLKKIKEKDLIFISTLNPEPGQIYGNSILKGMPYLSSILLKIFEAINQNWERIGNTRYILSYKPPNENFVHEEHAKEIAKQWSMVFNSSEQNDFISIGDSNAKVIGADSQVLDSHIPVRQILEQILSKLSIPPFLLGLSWSTTESMSEQQSDLLASELEGYRRILEPVIKKITFYYFALKGEEDTSEILWQPIKLRDKLRLAQTDLINAKTEAELNKLRNSYGGNKIEN